MISNDRWRRPRGRRRKRSPTRALVGPGLARSCPSPDRPTPPKCDQARGTHEYGGSHRRMGAIGETRQELKHQTEGRDHQPDCGDRATRHQGSRPISSRPPALEESIKLNRYCPNGGFCLPVCQEADPGCEGLATGGVMVQGCFSRLLRSPTSTRPPSNPGASRECRAPCDEPISNHATWRKSPCKPAVASRKIDACPIG